MRSPPLPSSRGCYGVRSPGAALPSDTLIRHEWRGASSISRAGGTAGWLWNLRSEWTTGRSAYLAVPDASSPSTIGKTGPSPTNVHLGTGGPEPSQAGQHPSGGTPSGEPPAWTGPRSDPRVRTRDSSIHRLGPVNPGLPGSQSNAAAARRHGSRSREANSQECVDTHGASSQDDPARTPPSWNCLNRCTRLIDRG